MGFNTVRVTAGPLIAIILGGFKAVEVTFSPLYFPNQGFLRFSK
jgi:hypothetical protein